MLVVYFETQSPAHAEIVSFFASSELYNACLPALERYAKKHHWPLITESAHDGVELNDVHSHLEEAKIL